MASLSTFSVKALKLSVIALAFILSLGSGCRDRRSAASSENDDGVGSHYERNEEKHRVIVFVHGTYGSAADTWKCAKTGNSWPKMLLSDSHFANSDVYVAQYPTHKIGNLMSIDDQVSNLMNRFEADGIFAKHEEVVFVAHSMGGGDSRRSEAWWFKDYSSPITS
jgi:triacylglycerol esterase/lipase EstA (alpha/beta hydrolase family)